MRKSAKIKGFICLSISHSKCEKEMSNLINKLAKAINYKANIVPLLLNSAELLNH